MHINQAKYYSSGIGSYGVNRLAGLTEQTFQLEAKENVYN